MMHQAVVYYTFCSRTLESPGIYLQYQRKLADKMLNHGFIKCFNIEFDRNNVAKGKYGKPYWRGDEEIQFNVSNTRGLVVCALSDTEIGVDAEGLRAIRMPVIRRCCAPEEMAYLTEGNFNLAEKEFNLTGEEFDLKEKNFNLTEENYSKRGSLKSERDGEKMLFTRFFQIWTLKESYIKMTGEGMRFPMKDAVFSIEEKEGTAEIICNQPGFFAQRRIKDYWISLCAREEVKVSWQELKVEEL